MVFIVEVSLYDAPRHKCNVEYAYRVRCLYFALEDTMITQ